MSERLGGDVNSGLLALGAAIGVAVVLLVARVLVLRFLRRRGEGRPNSMPAMFARIVRLPSIFWALAIALAVGVQVSAVPAHWLELIRTSIEIVLIVSLCLVSADLFESGARLALGRTSSPMLDSGLIKAIIRFFVFGTGALIVLSHLGVQIGPLLAALGVGGLAVALAFKDTFENLFSGINLLIDRSIEVGDLIKLESGQEGHVIDIGWRTSKLRLDADRTLIIPNTKLAQTIVIKIHGAAGSGATGVSSLTKL